MRTQHDHFDVIIVGGGVVGCSIAYRLAGRGQRVLLLEARNLGDAASSRNGGITGAGSSLHAKYGSKVYDVTSANWALMQTLSEELAADFEFIPAGTLDVATTPDHLAHLERTVAMQRAAGLDVHLLDRHEARELMPALSKHILGAELAVERGRLTPRKLVDAFAAGARRLGAELRTGVRVTGLLDHGGRVDGVMTDGGTFHASEVVLATNAYTHHLLPDLPRGALVPTRGQALATSPLPPMLPHAFGTNFDKEYGRQLPSGEVLCGGFRRLDDDAGLWHEAEETTPAVQAGIEQCLTTLFPALAGVPIARRWAGIMGFTADGLPLLGRYPTRPGLTLAAGFNGNGFSWAAITGVIIAALLTGEPAAFDLTPFNPGRFAEGSTAWENPFMAGERSDSADATLPMERL